MTEPAPALPKHLYKEPCPCGCQKFIVRPLFNSVDASVYEEHADELIRRWNIFADATVPTVIPNVVDVDVCTYKVGDKQCTKTGRHNVHEFEIV